MESKIPPFLLVNEPPDIFLSGKGKTSFPFLEQTLVKTAKSLKTLYIQAESSGKKSLICNLNPITKVISFLFLIVIISLAGSITSQFLIGIFIFILLIISGVSIFRVYKNILLIAFFFGFLISAPAAFNVITPGEMILPVFSFAKPHNFWIYHIPREIGITLAGCKVLARLFLRIFNSVSLSFLLVYSTPFSRVLKAFRILFIPYTLLMIVWLAYKFIYILCRTIEETYFALKSRFIRDIKNQTSRKIVTGRIFFIYEKARLQYEQTYSAMISRGYNGQIILVAEKSLTFEDVLILICVVFSGIAFIFI